MATPLSEINWDNLEGHSMVTAINILQKTFSERSNVAQMTVDDGPDNQFPFANNTPDFGRAGGPYVVGTISLQDDTLVNFARPQSEIDSQLGQNSVSFDPRVTKASFFANHGVADWPELFVANATDVKKLYDMVTSLKKIVFRASTNPDFNQDNYVGYQVEGLDGLTDYSISGNELAGAHSQIWSGPTTLHTPIGGGDIPISIGYTQDSSDIENMTALKGYQKFNRTELVASGFIGVSGEVVSYGGWSIRADNQEGIDWLASQGIDESQDEKALLLPSVNVVVQQEVFEGDLLDTKTYDIEFDVPPRPSPWGVGKTSGAHIVHQWYVEDWDYEGGFEFYTPTP